MNQPNIRYLDKHLYLLPLLWSKTTLFASYMGEKRVNLPTYKIRIIFLCPWLLICQFSTKNLIGHELWKLSNLGQILKVSTAHVWCGFLLKIGTTRSKNKRKMVLILYTVRKSFREFQKSVFIHELLHKIFCKEGLDISEILWAFRICTTSKCQTNNKVKRSVYRKVSNRVRTQIESWLE